MKNIKKWDIYIMSILIYFIHNNRGVFYFIL